MHGDVRAYPFVDQPRDSPPALLGRRTQGMAVDPAAADRLGDGVALSSL
jgi:hypothetical protein